MSQTIKIVAVICLLQVIIQIAVCGLGIAQYACLIDILREVDYLVFIKILYFVNPARYGSVLNIGNFIEGIPNQAFVLIKKEPFTVTRTLVINCVSLGLGFVWAITTCVMLAGSTRNHYPRSLRWPWMVNTFVLCGVDLVASVAFLNDSFHTRSLEDVMGYIGGAASGTGGAHVDTSAAAWIMLALYSRGVLVFALNVGLTVLVALSENAPRHPHVESSVTESPNEVNTESPKVASQSQPDVSTVAEVVEGKPEATGELEAERVTLSSFKPDGEGESTIPRAHLRRAYQNIKKNVLFKESRQNSPIELAEYSFDSNRADNATDKQKPWSYLPASPYQLRGHQLPSDEDLPPVPLPDYTAIGTCRKNSVHRLPSKPPATNKRKPMRRQMAVDEDVMF